MASQIIGTSTICSLKCIKAPRYWPFVRGIYRSPMDSSNKGSFHVFMKSIMGYFSHWNDRWKCWHGERCLLLIRSSLYNTFGLLLVLSTVFRSNSKFDKIFKCSSLRCPQPITTKFDTHHDCVTVGIYAKFWRDRYEIFLNQITANFGRIRILSKYR